MKEQLDKLRADLEALEKTPLMLKPARAEQAVRRSFEILSELAQAMEQLRFRFESLEQAIDLNAIDGETVDHDPA